MQLLHLDLRLIQDSTYALRCFESNPNEYDPRRLDLGEIAELLKRAETHYYTYLPDHEAMGRKLFDWLDGEDGFLRQVLARCSSGTVLAIAAGERLANLPWEVLHDGADFLVKQRVVPVRWVRGAENALSRTEEPENRPLNVLFMATDPEGQASLQFEAEEGRILQATAQFPLQLDVEESGCLTELRYTVQAAAAAFDVFHLTGHATITEAGARFATETETGDLQLASAADIAQAIRYQSALPRLVFVSGCKTGQSATTQGEGQDVALPSLAEELLGWGAGAVLGWGQKVQDDDATLAAAALYRELAAGETVVTALGQVYERLLTAEARDWHLLRLYVRGSLPGALVTPSRTRGRQRLRRRKTKEQFLDPQTRKSKVAGRESFVGRRRVLQACLRVLLQLGDEVGILLHGMGGLGKSTVARRLCDRLQDRDYKLIFWEGTLNEARLVSEIAKQVDDKALRDMVLDEPRSGEALKYRLRRLFEQLPDDEQWLLVWDDFEAGNVEPQGGGYRLTPEARQLWGAVQWAIEETGAPHRVIVTCRYQVRMAGLFEQPLASLKGSDLFKKCQQLEAFKPDSKVEEGLQARAQGLADGNPRLLEWLDKVLVAESVDAVAVIRRLETDKSDLMERVLAAELLARVAGPLRVLLSRGLIFELPVPKAALLAIAEDENAEGLIDRAVALGLLEVSPDGGLRVPRVLPLDVPEDEALAAAAARVLYGLWWEEAESSTEAQRLEVHRLAIEGKEGEIAATIANALNKNWINRSGYRDVVNLCEKTISIVENAQIFNSLARSQRELGEPEPALRNFEKALNVCTEDAESDRASILHEMAIIYAQQGKVDEAIALYQQSLELKEKIGNVQGTAATLHQMAIIYAQQGKVDEAIALYQQSLEITEKIGNVQTKAATLHQMAGIYAQQGEVDEAIALYQQSLETTEKIGDVKTKAATLGQMAHIYQTQGDLEKAFQHHKQAFEIAKEIGHVQYEATALHCMAGIYANQGQVDEAIALYQQSLELKEKIGDVQGKAATLAEMARIYKAQGDVSRAFAMYEEVRKTAQEIGHVEYEAAVLHQMAGIYANQGEVDEAIALYQQSLELKEKIGNVQGKAATLHQMAIIYADQGQVDEATALYQQSLELKEKIGDVQGKAATLHQMAIIYANQGQVEEAIALYQQVLEIDEKIGNVQGKAATLAMMGQLLADARQEYSQGLAYLAESLQILVHLKSPSAQTVREIMARIEQNRG